MFLLGWSMIIQLHGVSDLERTRISWENKGLPYAKLMCTLWLQISFVIILKINRIIAMITLSDIYEPLTED